MTCISRMGVGSVLAALLLVPIAPSTARADDDDRWEDWREAEEEWREDMEDRWEDQREAREEWREEQRERWEDWHEDMEDRAEDHAKAQRRAWRHGDGHSYAPYPYREYWEPLPEYRYYRPHYGRYYGTRRFGYYDHGHGGSVRVGPVWVQWD